MTVTMIKTPQDAEDAPGTEASSTRPERRRARYRRIARAALQDERVRTAGRLTVRHGAYVLGGTRVVGRRIWDGRTASRYERMIRAAEAAGLLEEVKEWEARGQNYRAARHRRRMELLQFALNAPKAIGAGAVGGAGILLLIGILLAWANHDITDVAAPFETVADLVRWVSIIVGVIWGPALALAPWIGLAAVWAIGQHRHTAPQWALPVSARDLGAPITASIVVVAFRDLGISALRKAIDDMGDVGAGMLSPIAIAGCGVEVDVHLPSGVSTEEIQNKRRKLAENLNRHEHEVFITIPPQPRTVRLWIADSGALDEPIGASPLVLDQDATADYYTGSAPWGQNLRGDAVGVSVKQRHILLTGLSNQGKTAALRALALWLALDETVDFYIADLKGVGDWRGFDGLAEVLIQGPTDEHVAQATDMVEWAVDEMQKRIALLEESGATDGVTREMARTDKRFRPVVLIVDEAQVAYGCGAKSPDGRPYGGSKATSRYFQAVKRIHDQGRAVNVTIWEGTQDPTDENLPKRSREGNHIRGSLVLGTESQAKMALGEAPVDAGAAPHKLRRGLDKGTLVVAGEGIPMEAGQASVTVRTHFISGEDAVTLTDRAKARRANVATVHKLEVVQPVDHLADLAAVVGRESRVRTTEVIHRLKTRNHAVYEHWNGARLKALLAEYGEEPGTLDGYPVVKLESVERALERRAEELAEVQ
ncbi:MULTISPECIES: FtsK/SpoIIIE domain-containing protein [Streptomyces]|uniref:Cell division protein FtsK n=1 Tax=Streptomyces dengpaensis TaxID=2049881 RepID=A0ABM6SSZ4_9ACTN|nr:MULTISPECIES: FtsK/SpoIIIE domain-containing protein [Streptomyces]AVH57874.1 cell division protein FtsK [Streptomyces dengpaensis]PIB03946.1 cell division protein FtsK [Streptomyces sp. HG99]